MTMPAETAVVPLNWQKPSKAAAHEGFGECDLIALGLGGHYGIQKDGGGCMLWRVDDPFAFDTFSTVEAAKAHAEADWQAAIRRCTILVAAPAVATDGDREAVERVKDMAEFLEGPCQVAFIASSVAKEHASDLRAILTALSRPAPVAGEAFGVTGASDEVEALAVALFSHRCPGVRMTDEDLHYYRAAAERAFSAVREELDTPTPEPAAPEAVGHLTDATVAVAGILLTTGDVDISRKAVSKLAEEALDHLKKAKEALRARSSEPGGGAVAWDYAVRYRDADWQLASHYAPDMRKAILADEMPGWEHLPLYATTPHPGASSPQAGGE